MKEPFIEKKVLYFKIKSIVYLEESITSQRK